MRGEYDGMNRLIWMGLLAIALCLLLPLAALGAENSLTVGWSGMLFGSDQYTLEYERHTLNNSTFYIDYSPIGYSLGLRNYINGKAFGGWYMGLGYSHFDIEGEDLPWFDYDPEIKYFITLELGYKRAFRSGMTIGTGAQYLYFPKTETSAFSAGLSLGVSW
jgi:hypothetical protein